MFLNTRSRRFLSRSLALSFAVACGVSLTSVAQAQMATGSGCTNCGGASSPVVTYGSPAAPQYSQPMTQQGYAATSTVRQSCSNAYSGRSYSGRTYSGRTSPQRRYASSQRSMLRHRQPSRVCGTTYSNASVYSGGGCYSGGGSYTTTNRYPSSGVSRSSMQVSRPVMQTGSGCPGGNCR